MSDSKDDLLNRIVDDRPPEATRAEEVRRKMSRWFDGRRNVVTAKVTIWILGTMLIIAPGVLLLLGSEDTRLMLFGVAMLISGFSMNVVIKLWFWIVDTKLALIKELKLIQCDHNPEPSDEVVEEQLRDLTASLMSEAYGRKRDSVWEKMSRRTVLRLSYWTMVVSSVVMGITVGCFGGLAAYRMATKIDGPEIFQEDEWRFTSTGMVDVRSTVEYTCNPGENGFVTLSLPFGEAEVESVTVDGESAPYSQLDWRRIEVQLPPYECPMGPRNMMVKWRMPVTALDSTPTGLRVPLAPLLPARRYVLGVSLEPGCGYEFDNKPELDRQQMFYGQGRKLRTFYGSCGLVVPKEDNGGDAEAPATP